MDPLLDMAPCFYFSFADDGKLLHSNQTFCDVLGYTKEELAGAHLDQLLTLPSRIFFQTHWFPLLKLQKNVNELYITVNTREKAVLPLLVNSVRKDINGQTINECVGIMITNRQRYEDELLSAKKAYEAALAANTALSNYQQQLQEQATQLNTTIHRLKVQNQELKQVNKIVTHDLQEPVRKLLFYSEQLQQPGATEPEVSKNLERVRKLTQNLQNLVAGLQQFIWITELNTPPESVSLNALVTAAQSQAISKFPDKPLTVHVDALPEITGNAEQLAAMFGQIFDNVVRFSKKTELPSIRIQALQLEQNSLQHLDHRYRYKNYLRLSIIDNGIGFDPTLKEQIFELFYTTSGSKGAGLGLTLCKKVVEYHEGTITADSVPGKGTTITITLPVQQMTIDDDFVHRR